ncbi:DEAD/DEAH box helicase [Shewanella sedimentimangrovi]|uniref:DNA2/NAM7 family helicase n=1 Tax=Shewanella sedimentimangrovi TaxID=2814293 RepID=A0ABX7R129_9GAMM|nr:DEAD/DEAH box helicase [Shewanella sedimentimangrovi]QSX37012.1 DNA2/NAM7 family helicase [Shewanella sedimentimangrovi]
MQHAKHLLAYYHDCYQEDCVDLNLWHLGRLKKEDRLFLEGEEILLNGFLPRQPLEREFAEALQPRIAMYLRERVLLYCSHFVVGQIEENGQQRPIFSPLVFREALLEQDGDDYYVSLKDGNSQINEPLLKLLLPEDSADASIAAIGKPEQPETWTGLLGQSSQQIDVLGLLGFPKLTPLHTLQRYHKKAGLGLFSASALVFLERPAASRGILHEVATMQGVEALSAPLLSLTGGIIAPRQLPPKGQSLPCLLSRAQEKVLNIAANQSLGCVIGPPGTGKSYSIAAVAAEHMARGESVLIVAGNEHALDVINDKLSSQFGLQDISLRAGQKAFLKQLKDYLEFLLSGYQAFDKHSPTALEKELKQLNTQMSKQEARLLKFLGRAIRRGQRLHRLERSGHHLLHRLYLQLTSGRIRQLEHHWGELESFSDTQATKERLAAKFLQTSKTARVSELMNLHRQQLKTFNQAIRSRTSQRQQALFENLDYRLLQKAFPIWLVSLNTLHRVLPLQRELFDLVIFDEATQSNITSALPALFRAKRALVVGDGKQLRHVSFLSRAKEMALQQQYDLSPSSPGVSSYRDQSILDLVAERLDSQQQIAFLDEHFRSAPELIHFSNQQFYQSRLRVMQHRPCTSSGHLHLHQIKGSRSEQGVNQAEIDALIGWLKTQISAMESSALHKSIGVISPFRAQADALNQALLESFSSQQLANFRLRADTPFGFQGEERDIMLLSFAVDAASRRATVYLNREDVFNVTITRAREQQHLFISVDADDLPADNLLARYLKSAREFIASHSQNNHIDDFQRILCEALTGQGIETWCGYELAGTEIDVLCRHSGKYLALDLIGFPGPWQDFFEINTYKILHRAGLNVLPISYGLWTLDPKLCIQRILKGLAVHNH